MNSALMPLGFLKNNNKGIVNTLNGGQCMHSRLKDMGIVRGTKINMIKNDFGGPVIICTGNLGENRLVLGRGLALKIIVEQL